MRSPTSKFLHIYFAEDFFARFKLFFWRWKKVKPKKFCETTENGLDSAWSTACSLLLFYFSSQYGRRIFFTGISVYIFYCITTFIAYTILASKTSFNSSLLELWLLYPTTTSFYSQHIFHYLEEACHPSPCGVNTKCEVVNYQPVCSCLPSFKGTTNYF